MKCEVENRQELLESCPYEQYDIARDGARDVLAQAQGNPQLRRDSYAKNKVLEACRWVIVDEFVKMLMLR